MARLVMKFGGTSVGTLDRMRAAAARVKAEADAGESVAVVVSAMAGETNRLVDLAAEAGAGAPETRDETDVLLATGEQASAALFAMILRGTGLKARSWQGWQAGVQTTGAHGKARISDFDGAALGAAIDSGEVAVLTGFQGMTEDGRVTTLGRGGSDLSAVAAAAALKAGRCDIYTDVDGVYTTDPRIVKSAHRIDRISFEEMLELASLGAKVLHTRSVELAAAKRVPLRVLSSFVELGNPNPGTLLCPEDQIMEERIVTGVAYTRDEAKITLLGLPEVPGTAAKVFACLAEADINVDMIVQSPARGGEHANMVFTVSMGEVERAKAAIIAAKEIISFKDIVADEDVSKVSVIGLGMRSHSGVAHTMFSALASKGISIEAVSTSEIKISVLIRSEYTELAVRALHTAFGLDA